MNIHDEINEIRRRAGLPVMEVFSQLDISTTSYEFIPELNKKISKMLKTAKVLGKKNNVTFVFVADSDSDNFNYFLALYNTPNGYKVGHALVTNKYNSGYHQIEHSEAARLVRGFGLPLMNYLHVITKSGIRGLMSSRGLSPGSIEVWKGIIKSGKAKVFYMLEPLNRRGNVDWEPVYIIDNELVDSQGNDIIGPNYYDYKDDRDDTIGMVDVNDEESRRWYSNARFVATKK